MKIHKKMIVRILAIAAMFVAVSGCSTTTRQSLKPDNRPVAILP